jgi:hypothetical protein
VHLYPRSPAEPMRSPPLVTGRRTDVATHGASARHRRSPPVPVTLFAGHVVDQIWIPTLKLKIHQRWRALFLIAACSCALTACIQWPAGQVSSKDQPKLLYEKAVSAVERGRYEVANLTLQTLVNTYPDSEYAIKAQELLEDPRIEPCGQSSSFSGQCDGRREAVGATAQQ